MPQLLCFLFSLLIIVTGICHWSSYIWPSFRKIWPPLAHSIRCYSLRHVLYPRCRRPKLLHHPDLSFFQRGIWCFLNGRDWRRLDRRVEHSHQSRYCIGLVRCNRLHRSGHIAYPQQLHHAELLGLALDDVDYYYSSLLFFHIRSLCTARNIRSGATHCKGCTIAV
jgi:hypothetical protein